MKEEEDESEQERRREKSAIFLRSWALNVLWSADIKALLAGAHLDMEFSEVRSLGDLTVLKLRLGCDTAGDRC